jgi:hypothetical protein
MGRASPPPPSPLCPPSDPAVWVGEVSQRSFPLVRWAIPEGGPRGGPPGSIGTPAEKIRRWLKALL